MGLVTPKLMAQPGRRRWVAYSLEDLVHGLVVAELEARDIDIRVIRRVVEGARTNVHPEPLSQLSWGTDGHHVYVGYPDGSWVSGQQPGQGVIVETINLAKIRVAARQRARERDPQDAGRIITRRGVRSSKPVFAGTRTPVDAVQPYLRRHLSDERILAAFPDLTLADIDAARRQLEAV
jgi:uncharacterized protein (DUF433 family)